jgi:hypothetical protein
MAIWQFKFALAPKNGIDRIHGNVASFLSEYQASEERSTTDNEEFPNYWEGQEIGPEHLQRIANILPEAPSWSNEAKMFGIADGDRIEVWKDDLECALDLRSFSISHLQAILDFAVELDCKLVIHGSGEIVEPTLANVVEKIQASRAYAFCTNPADFLRHSS